MGATLRVSDVDDGDIESCTGLDNDDDDDEKGTRDGREFVSHDGSGDERERGLSRWNARRYVLVAFFVRTSSARASKSNEARTRSQRTTFYRVRVRVLTSGTYIIKEVDGASRFRIVWEDPNRRWDRRRRIRKRAIWAVVTSLKIPKKIR